MSRASRNLEELVHRVSQGWRHAIVDLNPSRFFGCPADRADHSAKRRVGGSLNAPTMESIGREPHEGRAADSLSSVLLQRLREPRACVVREGFEAEVLADPLCVL